MRRKNSLPKDDSGGKKHGASCKIKRKSLTKTGQERGKRGVIVMVRECLERLPAQIRGVDVRPSQEELDSLPPRLKETWKQRAERAKAEPM